MGPDAILAVLIAAVTQSQEQSLRAVGDFHADTRLIGDVPGCDSLAAIELSFLLADELAPILGGREFPDALLLGPQQERTAHFRSNRPKDSRLRLFAKAEALVNQSLYQDEQHKTT